MRILVVRLGAMGDIVQTLPAVASLKHSMPHSEITWVIESKWRALLADNPYVDKVVLFDRFTMTGLRSAWRELRRERFDLAIDFQGLIKSALVAACGRPERLYGFNRKGVREKPAAWFYSTRVASDATHRVDKYLDLAARARRHKSIASLSPARASGRKGSCRQAISSFASPFAGWGSKQWPPENYSALGQRLRAECGIELVLNGAGQNSRGTHVAARLRDSGINSRDAKSNGGSRRQQRTIAHCRGARQTRSRHLRSHRSGHDRPLRQDHQGSAQPGRGDHLQKKSRAGCEHARHFARSGV